MNRLFEHKTKQVSHRAFGVEIAASFVNTPWAWPSSAHAPVEAEKGETNAEAAAASSIWDSLVALVESFASRVLDKAPTVRARAMVCLSEMLISVREGAAPPGKTSSLSPAHNHNHSYPCDQSYPPPPIQVSVKLSWS